MAPCKTCGKTVGVMLLRGRRFLVPMCEECALVNVLIDPSNGLEFRVIAIASERFPQPTT